MVIELGQERDCGLRGVGDETLQPPPHLWRKKRNTINRYGNQSTRFKGAATSMTVVLDPCTNILYYTGSLSSSLELPL